MRSLKLLFLGIALLGVFCVSAHAQSTTDRCFDGWKSCSNSVYNAWVNEHYECAQLPSIFAVVCDLVAESNFEEGNRVCSNQLIDCMKLVCELVPTPTDFFLTTPGTVSQDYNTGLDDEVAKKLKECKPKLPSPQPQP